MFGKARYLLSRPIYILSWIVLIGSSIATLLFPVLGFEPSGLPVAIFCGIIAANIAKRKGRSPWLWFFIGLIPIGVSLFYALCFLSLFLFFGLPYYLSGEF